jgi:hypothetical protein
MLWFGKQAKAAGGGADPNAIEPRELAVELDAGIAETKLNSLLGELSERGGVGPVVEALRLKAELFAKALPAEEPSAISRGTVETLLAVVFPARRKVAGHLAALSDEQLGAAVRVLVYGQQPLAERMAVFCELIPKEDKKPRRALWDFAAELIHFRVPEQFPLMARWVWDVNTQSGALREFIKAGDALHTVPLGSEPGVYEAARSWCAEVLAKNGFYRDIPFMIDLLQAQAYSEYVKSVSTGVGMVDAQFGGRQDPVEFILKLLGIEARARDRQGAESAAQEPTVH